MKTVNQTITVFSYQDIYLCVLQCIKKKKKKSIEEDRLFLKTLHTDLLKMKNVVKVIQK